MERKSQATKYPGIYRLTRPGKADRFMVSFRIRGVGQRTKTFPTLREARAFQATARDPEKARRLKGPVLRHGDTREVLHGVPLA